MSDMRTPGSSPFYAVAGFIVDEEGEGACACSSTPHEWLDELAAAGSPAAALGFADMALASSVATIAAGRVPATTSLQIDFVAPVPTGPLTCSSRVTDQHDGVVLAEGSMAAEGMPVGRVTLRSMLITARPVDAPVRASAPPDSAVGVGSAAMTGILGGGLATACGARLVAGDERSLTMTLVPVAELGRSHGVMHGGAIAAIGALGIAATRERLLTPGARWRHLDARVDFLREIPMARTLEVRASARHLGRRLALFEAELIAADGRLAATARETVVIQV